MNSNTKILILIICAIFFFWINYKYKNIFIRTYNWFSGIPKMVIVFVTIIALFSPALLRNNKAIDYFSDFLPDSINKQIYKTKPKIISQQPQPFKKINKPIKTSQIRKVSEQAKKLIASNQKWKCNKCNETLDATYEVDHVIALDNGGNNNLNNLQALCRNCHGRKTMSDNMKKKYPNGKL